MIALAFALLAQDNLIEQLGNDDPRTRQKAEQELVAQGAKALPALEKALGSADLDTRKRIERIVRKIKTGWEFDPTERTREELRLGSTPFEDVTPSLENLAAHFRFFVIKESRPRPVYISQEGQVQEFAGTENELRTILAAIKIEIRDEKEVKRVAALWTTLLKALKPYRDAGGIPAPHESVTQFKVEARNQGGWIVSFPVNYSPFSGEDKAYGNERLLFDKAGRLDKMELEEITHDQMFKRQK